jgi:hypothetical protein
LSKAFSGFLSLAVDLVSLKHVVFGLFSVSSYLAFLFEPDFIVSSNSFRLVLLVFEFEFDLIYFSISKLLFSFNKLKYVTRVDRLLNKMKTFFDKTQMVIRN